jgi:hypothetical protein
VLVFKIPGKLRDNNIFNMDICGYFITATATHEMMPLHSHSLHTHNASREGRVYRVAVHSCVNFVTRRKHSYRIFVCSDFLSEIGTYFEVVCDVTAGCI